MSWASPSDFDSPKWNWHQLTAWVERPQDHVTTTSDEASLSDAALVAVDINCDAGLFVFNVETQTEDIWVTHVRQKVVVAKTDSVWDGFKRFIGYEDDVQIDNFGMMYISKGYPVDKVTALSTLPAAQALIAPVL